MKPVRRRILKSKMSKGDSTDMTTLEEANKLRTEIERQSALLASSKEKLYWLERNCQHEFGEAKYTPEYHPGHHFAGDPPGTMGVDRQLPMDVPSETIPKWTRTCKICGKTETTTSTKDVITKKPIW